MRWLNAGVGATALLMGLLSAPALATPAKHHVLKGGPASQGYYQMTAGSLSNVELRGLRVPLDIEPSHGRMLELAAYWATLSGAYLRVVSAMDHIHGKHSAHYSGDALDFQGQQLDDFAKWMRAWGFVVLYKVRGHYNHVHVQTVALWHQPSHVRYTRSRSH